MSTVRVNHFTAAAGRDVELHEFLKSLMPFITGSEGCITAEVLRNQEETNKFVVIERWQSPEDHRASVDAFPKEAMEAAMALFAEPPAGAYYKYS